MFNNGETGKTNAHRFVALVAQHAREGRVVIVYANSKHHSQWPWMKNPAWQNYVLDQLEHKASVRNAEFHPADSVDGLCFTAISIAADHRIERLALSETIEGLPPPRGFVEKIKWMLGMVPAMQGELG